MEKNILLWKDHLRSQHGFYYLDSVKAPYQIPPSGLIVDTVGLVTHGTGNK